MVKSVHVRALLRTLYHGIRNPAPRGIKGMGENSVYLKPRQIDGARFISIGNDTYIHRHGWLSAVECWAGVRYEPEILIGNNVHIGGNVWITCISQVVIEDGCVLGERVYISDAAHGLDPDAGPIMKQKLVSKGNVLIQKNSFIGYGACIMPGVTLGKHCIVGTNSVVTHSFPDYSMVAGVPARLIKTYSLEQRKWISHFY